MAHPFTDENMERWADDVVEVLDRVGEVSDAVFDALIDNPIRLWWNFASNIVRALIP